MSSYLAATCNKDVSGTLYQMDANSVLRVSQFCYCAAWVV